MELIKKTAVWFFIAIILLSSIYAMSKAEDEPEGEGTYNWGDVQFADTGLKFVIEPRSYIIQSGQPITIGVDYNDDNDFSEQVTGFKIILNGKRYATFHGNNFKLTIPFWDWYYGGKQTKVTLRLRFNSIGGGGQDEVSFIIDPQMAKKCLVHKYVFVNMSDEKHPPIYQVCQNDRSLHYVSNVYGRMICKVCGDFQPAFYKHYTEEQAPLKEKHEYKKTGPGHIDICACGFTKYGELKKEGGKYVLYVSLTSSGQPSETELAAYHSPEKYMESELWQIANQNTTNLQGAMDEISKLGGGKVIMPGGDFYFTPSAAVERVVNGEKKTQDFAYVVKCRDNVSIQGSKSVKTTLLPIADSKQYKGALKTSDGFLQANTEGVDMFYYNDYADSGFKNATPLKNAQFSDFIIDSGYTQCNHYSTAGKGFMINIFEDCTWENVEVLNTDGSGIGIDCPLGESRISGCKASGCGKSCNHIENGGSGFGIGIGYSDDEKLIIENCIAEENGKFGFFFEHQARFQPQKRAIRRSDAKTDPKDYQFYTAQYLESKPQYIVKNCQSSKNMFNYGGLMAFNVSYQDCESTVDWNENREILEDLSKHPDSSWKIGELIQPDKETGTFTPVSVFWGNEVPGSEYMTSIWEPYDLRSQGCSYDGSETLIDSAQNNRTTHVLHSKTGSKSEEGELWPHQK